MAIASLIIGIVLIVVVCSSFLFGIGASVFLFTLMGIAGLVLAILALRRKARPRIAIAGIVLNSLPVLWFIVLLVLAGLGT